MARKYDEEFNKWVLAMLKRYHISQVELGNRIGIETSYMIKILKGVRGSTKRTKCLIINFFEMEYDEVFVSSEKDEYITYGDWLDRTMLKYEIENFMIAQKGIFKESSIANLRKGLVELDILRRREILNILEKNYGVDISKGMELLNNTVNKFYKEMGDWIYDSMKVLGISYSELPKHINVSETTIRSIINGRLALSYKNAEELFRFFEERGIDTDDGRKKFNEMRNYKEKVKNQV